MPSNKKAVKAGEKGEPPPAPPQPPGDDNTSNNASAPNFCSWHLLALLPIILAFVIYHIPTLHEEYMARMG